MDNEVRAILLDQATRLLDAEVSQARLKDLLEHPGAFDTALWSNAIELGWPAIAIAEAAGGPSLGMGALAPLLQEMGRRTVSLPLVAGVVTAGALGGGEVAARLASGGAIATLALCESGDCGLFPTLAYAETGLTGEKAPAAFAAVATHALVSARDGAEPGLYLVDLEGGGVTRRAEPTIDNARATATLRFEGVPAIRVAAGWDAVLHHAAVAATLTAFEQVGGAERCLAISVAYAKERKAFGQPIGAFQAIKHKLADMYQELEIARGCAIDALEALEQGRKDFFALACTARLGASAAYDFAARECIQTHGGVGVTWEAEPQHHYRRARALALETGGAPFWRDLLIDGRQVLEVGMIDRSSRTDVALGAYVSQARQWLEAMNPRFGGGARHGLSQEDDLVLGRAFQKAKSEAGYAGITLPRELGGGGGTELQKILFGQEEDRFDFPTDYFAISLGMPVPMLLRYGDAEIVKRLVPLAIRGEHIWCQLFSEPSAGSDLAAVRTRAARDGDGWRIDGQKLWTSWAHVADYAIALVRTDPTVPKHAGLTFFWLNMKSPGITVKRIRKLAGESELNEVFFDNVHVHDSQRMGEVGAGFRVAIETLMIERYAVADDALGGPSLAEFASHAARHRINGKPAIDDGQVRRVLADAIVERQGLRSIHRRALAAIAEGGEPGPEGSIRKLRLARRRQIMGELAMNLMGAQGVVLAPGASKAVDHARSWIDLPGARIAGGTDEILRNTIAEKLLGLPQDYRPDKKVPFNQID